MASTRGSLQHAAATPVHIRMSAASLALVALIAVLAVTVAIALAANGGGSDYAKPVRVVPSAQNVPLTAERSHPGLNGPGMRP
jgi:cytochrome oxidase Cu insertion factor (SCO1/SenC/PrrC family)